MSLARRTRTRKLAAAVSTAVAVATPTREKVDAAIERARKAIDPARLRGMTLAQRRRALLGGDPLPVATAPAPERDDTDPGASEYALQKARLGNDIRRLREIQSIERKIELKRDIVPTYADWIAGVLAADRPVQDDIVVQVMIWTIDIGDFAGAMPIVNFVLRHKLPLPERFKRTAGCMIVEEIADAALKSIAQGDEFDEDLLVEVELIADGEDMPDQVKAKLLKAIGILAQRRAEAIDPNADGPAGQRRAALTIALDYLRKALGLDDRVGVKKEIERLTRELAKADAADA